MSNKLIYLVLGCGLCFQTCNTAPQTQSVRTDKAQNFLQNADVFLEDELLSHQLDSLGISAEDVYRYCQTSKALHRKTKWISSIYFGVENYLQTENPNYWLALMYDVPKFCDLLANLKTSKHLTFLDVGSGNGEKLFAALCMGFEKCYGIEYSEKLVKISQNFLHPFIQQKQIEVIHQDALDTTSDFFKKIDFVYLYSPIRDTQKMAELLWKIIQNLKDEAILAEMRFVYKTELNRISQLNFPSETTLILKKQKGKWYYLKAGTNNWNQIESLQNQ